VSTSHSSAPTLPCSDHKAEFPSCGISAEERKKAEALFEEAAKLSRNEQFDEALEKLLQVREISPLDTAYAAAENAVRAKVVNREVQAGDQALQRGDTAAAIAAFRRAVSLDPSNEYAAQRLHDANPPRSPALGLVPPTMGEVRLAPAFGKRTFDYRGPSPGAMEKFAALFGLTAVTDSGIFSKEVKIHLDDVDWESGSQILQSACKLLIIPLSERQILLVNNTEENRRELTHMSLRTFRPRGVASREELNALLTALRVLFNLRYVNFDPHTGDIAIRAPQVTLDAVATFLDNLHDERPAVILEVRIYQVSALLAKEIGVTAPRQFTVFNVPTEVNKIISSGAYQQIVDALQAAGQSVDADTILAALLATASSSPLTQPFATFGGGITLSAVTIPVTSLKLLSSRSTAQMLNQSLLRTNGGESATLKVGERFPIVSTQYSATTPFSNQLGSLGLGQAAATAISSVTTIPSPQFTYEDLGLVLKATPSIHGNRVTLSYELKLRALGLTQPNGLPNISSRENEGVISTADGQTVVIAGLISRDEVTSLNGIPLLSAIPGIGRAFSVKEGATREAELLITVTPHITSASERRSLYMHVPPTVQK